MTTDISSCASDSVPTDDCEHSWSKDARDGFQVLVAWDCLNGGSAIRGAVADRRSGAFRPFALHFTDTPVSTGPLELIHAGYNGLERIEVTLTLLRDGALLVLRCILPLDAHRFFDDVIDQWRWAPCPPGPLPDQVDGADVAIAARGDAGDLAPFIWLHPPDARERADARRRFVRCADPAVRALYANMDATKKIQAATAFMAGKDFVKDVALLGAPIAGFPAARPRLAQSEEYTTLAGLLADAEAQLALPSPVPEFLAGPAWQDILARTWQSLFALALAGQPAQAKLASQLGDILRTGHYLDLLNEADSALETPAARHVALAADIAVPDQLALYGTAPLLAGASATHPPDTWEVLGIGQLTMLRQQCVGYQPGELAEVVNVMPHARQEMSERTLSATATHQVQQEERQWHSESAHETSAASELADTLHEVMAADAMAIDLSKVVPSYANLNMMLGGSGAGANARSGWSNADSARLVRRLTEQAAKRVGDRVGRQRGREWQALREWRRSQSIDNAGERALVGIYRWVDRVVRVRAEALGARLVMAFVIEQPAHGWLARVAAQPPQALTAPPLPPAFTDITADNYQSLGAAYGLSALEAPPPAQLVVSTTVGSATLGDMSLLRVPDGYQVGKCIVTVALGDDTCALACSVGGCDLPTFPMTTSTPKPVPVAPLSVNLSQGGATAGPVAVQPGQTPVPVIGTTTVDKLPVATGAIPVTVVSSAHQFCVTVMLICEQLPDRSASSLALQQPLLYAWQLRTQAVLQRAWKSARQAFDAALEERIGRAGGGHGGRLQRQILRQSCLTLLQAQGDSLSAAGERWLASLFDWRHMTWQYEAPTAMDDNDWPRHGGEVTAPASDGLFQRFLTARGARVLAPLRAGAEPALLFYLQFRHAWIAMAAGAPVTEATLDLLEQLADPARDGAAAEPRPAQWTVKVPTSMMVLQDGGELPCRTD